MHFKHRPWTGSITMIPSLRRLRERKIVGNDTITIFLKLTLALYESSSSCSAGHQTHITIYAVFVIFQKKSFPDNRDSFQIIHHHKHKLAVKKRVEIYLG